MMNKPIYNHAVNADKEALNQFESCYKESFVVKAALMPDAHSGYAAPIGAVLVTKDYLVPAWVGFDIGCGLIAVKLEGKNLLKNIEKNKDKIYSKVKDLIPMGMGEFNKEKNITQKTKEDFQVLLKKFTEKPFDKNIYNYLKGSYFKHLGTLGGGNHFIELSSYKDEVWLVIHSGSRGLGYKVAEKYMKGASKSDKDFQKTFPLHKDSELGKEYENILDFGLEFALLNRLEMSYKVVQAIESVLNEKIKYKLWTNKNHNHALLEKGLFIHRKGATPAKKGERGVIPANMRDGSYLVEGKGSSKFLNSSSHGAGRAMSRKKARESFSLEDFKKSMQGIKGTVNQDTLDEIPMAYKNINEVMEAQKSSVKIVKHLSPLINWKGK